MKKIFVLLLSSLFILASCKKAKEDIRPADNNVLGTQSPTATAVPLTAKFTYTVQDPINIFENQAIKFSNQSTGASTWVWEFGNSTKSHDLEPAMSYPIHGYYTVTLSVWDDKGNKQSYSQDISVLCLFANGVHPPDGSTD
ncbi:MAG: PKD domain-containing protein [Ferruginibacter sp.]